MKITLVLLSFFLSSQGFTQILNNYPVSNSGCSVNAYCETTFKVEKSTDSSQVYSGECVKEDVTYGIICVKLLHPVENLTMAEDLLISYLDYLKADFGISKAAGYGKGYRLDNNEKTRGIIDYWEDKEKDSWKVKAWTDGKFIGVLYSYSKKPLPEYKVNVFLDSFRMPVN